MLYEKEFLALGIGNKIKTEKKKKKANGQKCRQK